MAQHVFAPSIRGADASLRRLSSKFEFCGGLVGIEVKGVGFGKIRNEKGGVRGTVMVAAAPEERGGEQRSSRAGEGLEFDIL